MNTAGELVTSKPDLRAALSEATGLELARGGVGRALDAMIRQRCAQLRCDESEYALKARDTRGQEFEALANAVTVVYTWFFRDRGQMAAMEQILIERAARAAGPVRVWVPGCATGEDCISIALLAERLGIDVRVLGTDINTQALATARSGRYAKASLREVDADMRRHFRAQPDGGFGVELQNPAAVRFERHNLMAPLPQDRASECWDLILCRNVLIYFRPECALQVFKRMARSLCDGGYLTLGASEVVYDVPEQLEAVYHAGRLVLRKTNGAEVKPARVNVDLASWPPLVGPRDAPVSIHRELCDLAPEVEELQPPETDPSSSHLSDGHLSLERGDLQQALRTYATAVESAPTCALARLYLGVTNYLCGNVEVAAHELRAALFLDEELWQAAFYLALAYDSLGLVEDAQREYRHVARLARRKGFERAPHHPLLVAWHRDVLELTQRRLRDAL